MSRQIISTSRDTNLKIAVGEHTTVAASDEVDTGLREVLFVTVSPGQDVGDAFASVSAAKSATAGKVTIKSWKTDGSDPTPVAASAFSKKVQWMAVGR
jgi:hypothetical protein